MAHLHARWAKWSYFCFRNNIRISHGSRLKRTTAKWISVSVLMAMWDWRCQYQHWDRNPLTLDIEIAYRCKKFRSCKVRYNTNMEQTEDNLVFYEANITFALCFFFITPQLGWASRVTKTTTAELFQVTRKKVMNNLLCDIHYFRVSLPVMAYFR